MQLEMLIAGFGGQGVLFAGKLVAHAAMELQKQVSWLPSYGPEMRGGTANCSVCVDNDMIGCPVVSHPKTLVVLNRPSFLKYIDAVAAGGIAVIDSSMIPNTTDRTDITCIYLPAHQLAEENGLHGLANMIMMGRTLREMPFLPMEAVQTALEHIVPPSKKHLLQPNLKALQLGYHYGE
jgi:2-oxoglutarate ferredoxin oxidoreductase subunit gamma